MLKDKIQVSAPGKLMLFGEHAVVYGRPCIVTAVDQRMRIKTQITDDNLIHIDAPDLGMTGYTERIHSTVNPPKELRFISAAIFNFLNAYPFDQGLHLETTSDFSSQFGFGSSSAVTVAAVKSLASLFEVDMSNEQLFKLCYKTVLDVQGVGSGFDLAAAIWGGTLYFVTGGKEIVPLEVESLPLVVGYTGIKADTATLVKRVAEMRDEQFRFVEGMFGLIELIVNKARGLIERGDFSQVGHLMNLNQIILEELKVSTTPLHMLISAANEAGAWGAKLSGAGGGDCMIALADNKNINAVKDHITKKFGVIMNVKTGAEGVRHD